MKKLLLSMAITVGFAGSALAADLGRAPIYKAPAPVPVANWTGCYIGAGGGYGMFNQDHSTLDPAGIPFAGQAGTVTTGGRGWFGTVQAGCDYQFAERWVVGAFGDWDFGSIKGNLSPAITGNAAVGEERLKNSWAVGGRLGYLILPQLLTFVSGGYTQARFDGVNFSLTPLAGPASLSMDAQTYKGWFIGSGVEYAIDYLPGLYWKTEYRFAQYQAERPALTGVLIPGGPGAVIGFEDSKKYVQTIRSELVYRFNFGGGPVVAKY
jgi:outer membrane immunogenic protein